MIPPFHGPQFRVTLNNTVLHITYDVETLFEKIILVV